MPVVVKCPHCTAKMSVGEGRVGDQVRCPGCKQHFTVDGKDASKAKKSKPARRRSGKKTSQQTLAVLLGVSIAVTFFIFLTVVYLANKRPKADPPRSDSGPGLSQFGSQAADKDPPRTAGKDGKTEPGAAAADPAVVDANYLEAVRLARKQEDEEPVKTAAALQEIPADDRERAEAMMKECAESPSTGLPEYGPKLVKWGLTEWVSVTSSKHARGDADFRAVAAAFTAAGVNSTELNAVMGRWCLMSESDRRTLAVAAREDWPLSRLPAETRTAVLALGGRKWLER